MFRFFCWFAGFLLLLTACDRPLHNPLSLPALTDAGVQVVVEIPAGTNHKIEINKKTGRFENDSLQGDIRVIDFLPYPGNYGFIPSTYMDPARGGDGDALDVLVLAESQPTGTVMATLPIGVMLLRDGGELDSKIIAVPADPARRIIRADNFLDFLLHYDPAKRLLEDWFLHYKGYGVMEFIDWKDEAYAMEEIRKWMVNPASSHQ